MKAHIAKAKTANPIRIARARPILILPSREVTRVTLFDAVARFAFALKMLNSIKRRTTNIRQRAPKSNVETPGKRRATYESSRMVFE